MTTPGPNEEQIMRVWRAVRSQFDRHATDDQLKHVNAITDAVITELFAVPLTFHARPEAVDNAEVSGSVAPFAVRT